MTLPNAVLPFRTEHYGAPPFDECECFEHRRIRELGAELVRKTMMVCSQCAGPKDRVICADCYHSAVARAEKAEEERDEYKADMLRLDARVAELERALENTQPYAEIIRKAREKDGWADYGPRTDGL